MRLKNPLLQTFCTAAASSSVASIAMASAYGDRSLEDTPTWAVATVCLVFVIISHSIEQGIHSIGMWFQRRQKKAMVEALEKIKAELMLLGFLSLLITVGTKPISKICISAEAADTMLPCKKELNAEYNKDGYDPYLCGLQGKVPLISQPGVHQLHIFLFVLAVLHVLYSVGTMALGQAKMKMWKGWEMETTSFEYHCTNDPSRFRLTHQISFVQRHSGLSTSPGLGWIVGFFRQFFASVTKVDYLTMRHGFINAHFAPNSKFDFHKYIKRSMEDDFKAVVGISMPLWASAIIFQLLNVYRWYTLSWISCVPLATLLLVGAKLEVIIMEMAKEIRDRTSVVKGAPVVEPSDKFFWFNRPHFILFLIHFTLFQNAFQMAYFLWIWYEFGLSSCLHDNLPATVARVLFGVALQIVCSYITFPLYALVTQMGSHMKRAIFEEQTAKALKKWQQTARERKKLRRAGPDVSIQLMGGHRTPSRGSSPIHLLHKHKPGASDIGSVLHSPKVT